MEQNSRKRPGQGVPRERPRTPASGPRSSRPRTGNAESREAARRERLAAQDSTRSPAAEGTRQTETRSPRQRSGSAPRQSEKKAAPRRAPAQKSTRARKKKPHRVYNTNFGFKFLTMLAVVAVIVLGMVIFFKVKHIEVVLPEKEDGSAPYYTAEELIEASGINLDENLLSLSKATVASRIHAALPYVNEIQVKKQLPGTVILSFTEFEVSYAIQDERGGWWLMSREGRILEAATEQSVHGHLQVTGMPIQVPEPGDEIKPAATEGADMSEIAAKQKTVLEILPALEPMPYAKQIASVDVSTSYDLTLWYGTRYEIRLGTTERLQYKLNFLTATLESSDVQRKSGTIDLSFNEDEKVHFLEFR